MLEKVLFLSQFFETENLLDLHILRFPIRTIGLEIAHGSVTFDGPLEFLMHFKCCLMKNVHANDSSDLEFRIKVNICIFIYMYM